MHVQITFLPSVYQHCCRRNVRFRTIFLHRDTRQINTVYNFTELTVMYTVDVFRRHSVEARAKFTKVFVQEQWNIAMSDVRQSNCNNHRRHRVFTNRWYHPALTTFGQKKSLQKR